MLRVSGPTSFPAVEMDSRGQAADADGWLTDLLEVPETRYGCVDAGPRAGPGITQ